MRFCRTLLVLETIPPNIATLQRTEEVLRRLIEICGSGYKLPNREVRSSLLLLPLFKYFLYLYLFQYLYLCLYIPSLACAAAAAGASAGETSPAAATSPLAGLQPIQRQHAPHGAAAPDISSVPRLAARRHPVRGLHHPLLRAPPRVYKGTPSLMHTGTGTVISTGRGAGAGTGRGRGRGTGTVSISDRGTSARAQCAVPTASELFRCQRSPEAAARS